jgi:hypothetical protein
VVFFTVVRFAVDAFFVAVLVAVTFFADEVLFEMALFVAGFLATTLGGAGGGGGGSGDSSPGSSSLALVRARGAPDTAR